MQTKQESDYCFVWKKFLSREKI